MSKKSKHTSTFELDVNIKNILLITTLIAFILVAIVGSVMNYYKSYNIYSEVSSMQDYYDKNGDDMVVSGGLYIKVANVLENTVNNMDFYNSGTSEVTNESNQEDSTVTVTNEAQKCTVTGNSYDSSTLTTTDGTETTETTHTVNNVDYI